MSKSIETYGHINEAGRVFIKNPSSIHHFAQENKGKEFKVQFDLCTKKRSSPQNRYYWGICIPLIRTAINELGNEFSKLETHEFLKGKFNYKEVELNDGHYIAVPISTAKLDTTGFMDYILKIQRFADEMLGIFIPDPTFERV